MTKTATRKPEKRKRFWHGAPCGSVERKRAPETVRKDITSGEVFPVERLIRFCVSPAGDLCPDLAHKLPGRGVWVAADCDKVAEAAEKNLFRKALHAKVVCPDNLAGLVDDLFVARIRSLIGFAKKAGQIVTGFEKVGELLKKGKAVAVLEASDAAADGREKITRLCGSVPVFDLLTAEQTAEALGAGICVHAALTEGGAADLLIVELRRFAAFRRKDLFLGKEKAD